MGIRLWSNKVENLIQNLIRTEESLLCVTGDIDNLGVFVAQNGRAEAENFVDIMNHAIGYYFAKELKMEDAKYIYIPSGEEILFMFLGTKEQLDTFSKCFYRNNKKSINSYLLEYLKKFNYPTYLGISFGIKFFSKDELFNHIKPFLAENDLHLKNKAYLSFMLEVRKILGRELDKEKFSDVLIFNKNINEVYLRNLVYREMLDYKMKTKEKIQAEKYNHITIRKDEKYGIANQLSSF